MANTDVRTLMLFEFNRALSYISEILEIGKKTKKLEDLKRSLENELYDWKNEEDFSEEEKIVVKEIIDELKKKRQDIESEMREFEEYRNALNKLVTKIIEAILEEQNLSLEKIEIRQDMLVEYIYLLCEIEVNDECIDIRDIFCGVEDFVILLCKMYGEDVTNLIRDIINDDLSGFDYYFE